MTQKIVSVFILFCSVSTLADSQETHALPAGAVYYSGTQQLTPTTFGDCYVEAVFSQDGSQVNVRTLFTDPHHNEVVGKEVVDASYAQNDGGYVYISPDTNAPVSWMLLGSQNMSTADFMEILFPDETHGHPHSATCENLSLAENTALTDIMEKFEHFEDHVEDHGDHHDDEDHDSHGHNH